jgi:hypothetical protein
MSCGCSCNDAYELPKGEKGDDGTQGIKGNQGDPGAKGIQGVAGDKGDAGTPAFKFIKPVEPKGNTTYDFLTLAEYNAYFSGNLTASADGTAAIAADYVYNILYDAGGVWKDATVARVITSVTVNPSSGIMTVTIDPAYAGLYSYRLILVG